MIQQVWVTIALATALATHANTSCAAGIVDAHNAVISPQVVPEDRYPDRRIQFAGGVVGLADLVYSTLPGFRPLRLDLYLPPVKDKRDAKPFVVYVHGGGWLNGHTRQSGAFDNWPNVLASLAARGYVVASIEYRLSSEAKFPAAEHDVKAAIRWLRTNATKYGIDKQRGLIWGASAGGQLAALTATSCGVASLESSNTLPSRGEPPYSRAPNVDSMPSESDCVQGAVAWYGIFDFAKLSAQSASSLRNTHDSADARYLGCVPTACPPAMVAAASAISFVDAKDPPMLLIHGTDDKTVPPAQSKEMYAALRTAGVHAELLMIPAVDHSFIGATPAATQNASRQALSTVFSFIDATIGPGAK